MSKTQDETQDKTQDKVQELVQGLNDPQKDGVLTTEGPVLILAGAGSGKTRVLTHRVAHLIGDLGVAPWNILAITFTNKAAKEMKTRVDKLVGDRGSKVWVATFHATCARILRRHADKLGFDNNFTIYDTDDSKSLMKDVCKRLGIDPKILKERAILSAISHAKDKLITSEEYAQDAEGDLRAERIASAYTEYQKQLKRNNALDFDDLIVKTVELFKQNPDVLEGYQDRFRYVMVDEYQDTNYAQFVLVQLLCEKYRNLCVVGDDDQSIYKFRGADIHNILDFETVYKDAKVIRLEQNYRSTGSILGAANAVIANNKGRKEKTLWTDREGGSKVLVRQFDNAFGEAEFIAGDICRRVEEGAAYSDCAVLYRTNAQSRLIEERMLAHNVPYDLVGGVNFYARKEIKDVLAYLKTIDNGYDDLAVRRIINAPRRGIGISSVDRLQEYADDHDMGFFDALADSEQVDGVGRTAAKMLAFKEMILGFREDAKTMGPKDLIEKVLETTRYRKELEESRDEEDSDRLENIDELISKAASYEENEEEPTLRGFLEEVALVADIDEVAADTPKVLMMTLHSAKGLEFPYVYLAGMEDGLFPNFMAVNSENPEDLEEERRLAYVGITRAKDELTLTCARQRMQRGESRTNSMSRFVKEIPEDVAEGINTAKQESAEALRPRPKAIVRPRAEAPSRTPYITKDLIALNVVSGVSKGVPEQVETPAYVEGDRVHHIKYGDGTVTALAREPRDYKVTVQFDKAGAKVMYASFAKLKKVGD